MTSTEEVWAYLGRRLNRDGSASHVWHDAAGEVCYFSLKTGRRATSMKGVIGAAYTITLTDGGGYTRGPYAGPAEAVEGDAVLLAEWTALDGLVTAHEAGRLAERRLKATGSERLGDMTLAVLSDLMAGLPRTQRAALEVSVLSLLRRGW